jgi:plasmid maintenance system antidote protein VapI
MDTVLTPADVRAELARRRIPRYLFAAQVHVHPRRLGHILNERIPLSASLARRIAAALDRPSDAREPGR